MGIKPVIYFLVFAIFALSASAITPVTFGVNLLENGSNIDTSRKVIISYFGEDASVPPNPIPLTIDTVNNLGPTKEIQNWAVFNGKSLIYFSIGIYASSNITINVSGYNLYVFTNVVGSLTPSPPFTDINLTLISTYVECYNNSQCNDNNTYTLDTCMNPGTTSSFCKHDAIACLNNGDCNDNNTHTEDVCLNPGAANAQCVHNNIACFNNSECGTDGFLSLPYCSNNSVFDLYRTFTCNNAGTTGSYCSNSTAGQLKQSCDYGCLNNACINRSQIRCFNNSECDDNNTYTQDTCLNPGTVNSSCKYDVLQCINDSDCSIYGNQCNDAKCNLTSSTCYTQKKPDSTPCNDSAYCTVNDVCTNGVCGGTARDCSGNNLTGIATCINNPDNNPFTWDFFAGFTSTCNEAADICTSGSVSLTHTCNITTCGAQCEKNSDCNITECDNLDGCYSGNYRDYSDRTNNCLSNCSCEANTCTSYVETVNDSRCGVNVNAGGPYSCNEGQSITLHGTATSLGNGTIVSYEWDLDNDGSFDDATGTDPNYNCVDDYNGKAKLKATDSNGRTGVAEANLVVNNVAPTATATVPAEGDVGVAVNMLGAGTDVPADTLSYSWKFGDGGTSNQQNPSHTYTSGGVYTVELTVSDDDGGSNKDTKTIKIYSTVKVAIDNGVSMISIPVVPKDNVTFNSMQQNCTLLGLAYWDPTKLPAPGYAFMTGDDRWYAGQGYFIKVNGSCSLSVRGLPFNYSSGIVGFLGTGIFKSGWNMIGATGVEKSFWNVYGTCRPNIAGMNDPVLISGAYIYDQNNPPSYYTGTHLLKPGKAYWFEVKAGRECSFAEP
jgi:hypothetical protein